MQAVLKIVVGISFLISRRFRFGQTIFHQSIKKCRQSGSIVIAGISAIMITKLNVAMEEGPKDTI